MVHCAAWHGLWLDSDALWRHDLAALPGVLQRGIQSEAHTAFVVNVTPRTA